MDRTDKPGRGRARINRPTRRLSRENFAFARGLLEGVDARVLWERFLYVDGSAPALIIASLAR